MSPTTQPENSLLDYSATAPPLGYSAQVTDGEELLARHIHPYHPLGALVHTRGVGIVAYIRIEDPVGHANPVMERNRNVHNSFHIPPSRSTSGTSSHTEFDLVAPIFHTTIKRAPEVWFETLSILWGKSASGLAPVEVQLFMPCGRTFGLANEIPFHIQLTGTASSIQTLYLFLSPLSASSEFRALTSTLTITPPEIRSIANIRVTLIRQVCVEVKDQAVRKSFSIGKGRIHPIPPPFELAVLADDAFLPPHSADHTEMVVNL
ncbi:hypothetical protein C8J55DRAFT_603463 [Lentinula edodes]|uniref:Uncharacterized protein n=1 Tax=Lentinula lateritia TaxID=40482 RepID=A0A9W9AVC7_9AGAR|nr:hypothetical protein C8J55DRAFT_603463 [Lentinula edodes]